MADVDIVTGGAGFIGSHLCQALVSRGRAVRVVDDFSSGRRGNLKGLDSKSLEVVEADIRDSRRLSEAMSGVRRVFHLAALTSVEESVRDPLKVHSVNLDGSLKVLEAARRAGAEKLVFASSTAVYGDTPELPKREDGPCRPLSPYAVSKLAVEWYCAVYSELYGLPCVCLRFFNVYGPRQDPASPYAAVVPRFIDRILRGRPPVIYGDGRQTRDFVFVADVVSACLQAADSEAGGVSLNVASGESVDLLRLAAELGRVAGAPVQPVHEAAREGEVRHSAASVQKAREAIGYRSRVSLPEGLKLTFEWFRKEN